VTPLWPALEGVEPVAAYAGLRPAGRGVNYLIGPSAACDGLVNVAAIRSTGLTASLGIAEHVCGILEGLGVPLGPEQPLEPGPAPELAVPWWRRSAQYRGR
jgi:glycerol-3-phosphate dehydrogenase